MRIQPPSRKERQKRHAHPAPAPRPTPLFSQVAGNLPMFGMCCYSKELIHRAPYLARGKFANCKAPFRQCLIAAPRAYCMLSHYPFFELHFHGREGGGRGSLVQHPRLPPTAPACGCLRSTRCSALLCSALRLPCRRRLACAPGGSAPPAPSAQRLPSARPRPTRRRHQPPAPPP
jgi:hypothetical protein